MQIERRIGTGPVNGVVVVGAICLLASALAVSPRSPLARGLGNDALNHATIMAVHFVVMIAKTIADTSNSKLCAPQLHR